MTLGLNEVFVELVQECPVEAIAVALKASDLAVALFKLIEAFFKFASFPLKLQNAQIE